MAVVADRECSQAQADDGAFNWLRNHGKVWQRRRRRGDRANPQQEPTHPTEIPFFLLDHKPYTYSLIFSSAAKTNGQAENCPLFAGFSNNVEAGLASAIWIPFFLASLRNGVSSQV
jgi:hypothetical protein